MTEVHFLYEELVLLRLIQNVLRSPRLHATKKHSILTSLLAKNVPSVHAFTCQ